MDDRVRALEAENAELRRQLAAVPRAPTTDAAAFLESLLGAVPAFIIRVDADMRILYINRLQPSLTMENVVGRLMWDFLTPDSVPSARECIERVLATGLPGTYEATVTGFPSTAHYETYVAPLAEPSGRPGVCLVSIDVTRHRAREEALRRSEQELRVAVEATGIALWSMSMTTGEVQWTPRTHELFGRAVPVGLTDYVELLVHPDDRAIIRASAAKLAPTGSFSGPIHRIVREDGGVRWILSRGRIEVDASGKPTRMIGGSLDVTQQHELEEKLRHAQRLDAIGHLTAGVAHNFNNMLTVLVGTLEILSRRLAGDDRNLLDGALDSALRGAEMVRQLMTFAGQRAQLDRRPHDIRPVIEQVVTMCRNTFERHIELSWTIGAELPVIRCMPSEIEQVVMNLLVNARDAVTDGGRPTQSISLTVDCALGPHGSNPPNVCITVTDDGVGMTEEVQRRAFDPFFSTKAIGTGLGLATSYAIVRELAGTMTCTSTPGVGTTMVVCVPGNIEPVVVKASPDRVAPARRRILLVDDDASVRRALGLLLRTEGFEVATAANGDEGLAHLETSPGLDIILLDRSMPGGPGETYVPRMRALAPQVPILMLTGQAVGPAIAALVDRVVLKPMTANALVEAIEALVQKR